MLESIESIFFSQRTVNEWNKFTADCVQLSRKGRVGLHIDSYMWSRLSYMPVHYPT